MTPQDPHNPTGLSAGQEQHVGSAVQPDAGLAWMSPELIEQTRELWSRRYGRILSEAEAVEILRNVRRLAEVVLDAQREPRTP